MEQLNFSIQIKAPKEMVWKALWEDKTNREWTAVFSEGSYAVSSWEEGSKVLFLSPSSKEEAMGLRMVIRNTNIGGRNHRRSHDNIERRQRTYE